MSVSYAFFALAMLCAYPAYGIERDPTERGPTERGPTERGPTERGPTDRAPTERVLTERGLNCSRPIVVPASSLGKLVVVTPGSDDVSGIYPDLLREGGKKAGCEFVFPVVPRARAEFMVRSGQADLLVGAAKVTERDAWGRFVPILGTEWMLISSPARGDTPPRTVQELLERPGIKFNAVRSYNYGPVYQAMLARLDKLGVLEYVMDPQTIVRKMQAGRADYTFMPSTTFAGTLHELGVKEEFRSKVRYSRLIDMPATATGVYLSGKITAGDASLIETILNQIRHDGEMLVRLRKLFSPAELSSSFALPGTKVAP